MIGFFLAQASDVAIGGAIGGGLAGFFVVLARVISRLRSGTNLEAKVDAVHVCVKELRTLVKTLPCMPEAPKCPGGQE